MSTFLSLQEIFEPQEESSDSKSNEQQQPTDNAEIVAPKTIDTHVEDENKMEPEDTLEQKKPIEEPAGDEDIRGELEITFDFVKPDESMIEMTDEELKNLAAEMARKDHAEREETKSASNFAFTTPSLAESKDESPTRSKRTPKKSQKLLDAIESNEIVRKARKSKSPGKSQQENEGNEETISDSKETSKEEDQVDVPKKEHEPEKKEFNELPEEVPLRKSRRVSGNSTSAPKPSEKVTEDPKPSTEEPEVAKNTTTTPSRRSRKPSGKAAQSGPQVSAEKSVEEMDVSSAHADAEPEPDTKLATPSRRSRKPSSKVTQSDSDLEAPAQKSPEKLEADSTLAEKEQQLDTKLASPSRRGRKPSGKVSEASAQKLPERLDEKEPETEKKLPTPSRRGRKPSGKVTQSEPVESVEVEKDEKQEDAPLRRSRRVSQDSKAPDANRASDETADTKKPSETEIPSGMQTPLRRSRRKSSQSSGELADSKSTSRPNTPMSLTSSKKKTTTPLPMQPLIESENEPESEADHSSPIKTGGRKRRVSAAAPKLDIINEEEIAEETTSHKKSKRKSVSASAVMQNADRAKIEIFKIQTPSADVETSVVRSSEVKRTRGRPKRTQPIPIEPIEEEPQVADEKELSRTKSETDAMTSTEVKRRGRPKKIEPMEEEPKATSEKGLYF